MTSTSPIPQVFATGQAIRDHMRSKQLKGNQIMSEAKALAAHWVNTQVTISETIEGERKALGNITVPVPTLAAFAIAAAFKLNDKQEVETDDDGVPLYAEKQHNFLQDCIIGKVQAKARNQLVPKTIELKEGKTIASNFDELFAESERDGTHLINRAEAVKAYRGFLISVGVKENVAESMARMFRDKESLASQSDVVKGKMKARIEAFTASLEPENLVKYGRTITVADEACATAALDPNGM